MVAPDSYPRQRFILVPKPLIHEANSRPLTKGLQITDAGWFPYAYDHEYFRPNGAPGPIFLLCTSGSGWVEVDEIRHEVPAPSLVVLPANVKHRYGASETAPWTIWWIHTIGTEVGVFITEHLSTADSPVLPLQNADHPARVIEKIISALEEPPTHLTLLRASGITWDFLSLLAVETLRPPTNDPVQRAKNYLASHLENSVSLDELAKYARVSPSYLGALFRADMGIGPLAHHKALRMERARDLLEGTDMQIAEVARATGYPDPLYFSRQFRQGHGVSPTQHREQASRKSRLLAQAGFQSYRMPVAEAEAVFNLS